MSDVPTNGSAGSEGAENRRRIAEAARELFEAHSSAFTLDDVAARSGTSVQTVLRAFGSKQQLLVETIGSSRTRLDPDGPRTRSKGWCLSSLRKKHLKRRMRSCAAQTGEPYADRLGHPPTTGEPHATYRDPHPKMSSPPARFAASRTLRSNHSSLVPVSTSATNALICPPRSSNTPPRPPQRSLPDGGRSTTNVPPKTSYNASCLSS